MSIQPSLIQAIAARYHPTAADLAVLRDDWAAAGRGETRTHPDHKPAPTRRPRRRRPCIARKRELA